MALSIGGGGVSKGAAAGYVFFAFLTFLFGAIAIGTPSWVNVSNPATAQAVFNIPNLQGFWSGLLWLTVKGPVEQVSFKVTSCSGDVTWVWNGWYYTVAPTWSACHRYYSGSVACFALQLTGIILAFFAMVPAAMGLKGAGKAMAGCLAALATLIFTLMLAGILTWLVWVYNYYYPGVGFAYSYALSATATSMAGMMMLCGLLMCVGGRKDVQGDGHKTIDVV